MSKGHKNNRNKAWVLFCLFCYTFALVLVYQHFEIQKMKNDIQGMSADINKTHLQVKSLKNSLIESEVDWLEGGYNYLAIGNSITRHPVCSYWWNEVGMAATDEKHDYYHLVLDYLEHKYTAVGGG